MEPNIYRSPIKPKFGAKLNRKHPLALGIIGCWEFNEGTGDTVYDLSERGNDGTLVTSPVWTCSKTGTCIYFNGTNDALECGNPSDLAINSMSSNTIVCRLNMLGINDDRILQKGSHYIDLTDTDANGANIHIKIDFGSGTDAVADTLDRISYGDEHLIVSTFNEDSNNRIKVYVDGMIVTLALDNAGIGTISDDSGSNFNIGSSYSGYYLNGSFSEFRIYNRALSADEIYLMFSKPFCDLVTPFTFDEQYYIPTGGWTGTINGVTNPTEINGIAVANIARVNGVA